MADWPSREEWAKQYRSLPHEYGYELHVSERVESYASPEEIAAALAEVRACWAEVGRQVKAAGPSISNAEWRRRYMSAGSREERDRLIDSPEFKRVELRD